MFGRVGFAVLIPVWGYDLNVRLMENGRRLTPDQSVTLSFVHRRALAGGHDGFDQSGESRFFNTLSAGGCLVWPEMAIEDLCFGVWADSRKILLD